MTKGPQLYRLIGLPLGGERATVALLISRGQCQLSAWHRAPSPQRLLITWAVTMMEVTARRHGAPVMVHLGNLHHSHSLIQAIAALTWLNGSFRPC